MIGIDFFIVLFFIIRVFNIFDYLSYIFAFYVKLFT